MCDVEIKTTGATCARLPGEERTQIGQMLGKDIGNVRRKPRQLGRELTITLHPLRQQTKARTGVDVAEVKVEARAKASNRETDRPGQRSMKRPSGYLL